MTRWARKCTKVDVAVLLSSTLQRTISVKQACFLFYHEWPMQEVWNDGDKIHHNEVGHCHVTIWVSLMYCLMRSATYVEKYTSCSTVTRYKSPSGSCNKSCLLEVHQCCQWDIKAKTDKTIIIILFLLDYISWNLVISFNSDTKYFHCNVILSLGLY